MNTKAKGTRCEHRSRRLLEALGYTCIRAAASLGAFDLAGFSATGIVLVQVKSNNWPGTLEMEELRSFPAPPGTKKLVHRWRDHARHPDVREL